MRRSAILLRALRVLDAMSTALRRSGPGRRGAKVFTAIAIGLVAVASLLAVIRNLPGSNESLLAAAHEADAALAEIASLPEESNGLNAARERLSRLARIADRAGGVESALIVLKRYRALARIRPSAGIDYFSAARDFHRRFPHAESLAAVLVDAALQGDFDGGLTELGRIPNTLASAALLPLRVAALLRIGRLRDPSPVDPAVLLFLNDTYGAVASPEPLAVNASLAALLADDPAYARAIVRDRLADLDVLPKSVLRFLAEFSFDFDDPAAAAALFSRLEGVSAALRRADAAFLAGNVDQARESWLSGVSSAFVPEALYNLARTAVTEAEAASYAARLTSEAPDFMPGILLAYRLAGDLGSSDFLRKSVERTRDPILALELIRNEAPRLGIERTIARTWLLVDAHPNDHRITEWFAWYLQINGVTDQLDFLLRRDPDDVDAAWLHTHRGLLLARSGDLRSAEALLMKAAGTDDDWRNAANLALLAEYSRNPEEALRRYEIAASLCPRGKDAAELQRRIGRVLVNRGKREDARRTLEYALDMDPENRRARADLRALERGQ